MAITPRQAQVLLLFHRYRKRKAQAPTLQEVADHLGITTKNGALTHIHTLWHRGYLTRIAPYARRGFRLTTLGMQEVRKWSTLPK